MTHHSIMSRLSTIISAALLLLPVSLHTHGQAVYSYNDTGAINSKFPLVPYYKGKTLVIKYFKRKTREFFLRV